MQKIIINILENNGYVLHFKKNNLLKSYTINTNELIPFIEQLEKIKKFKLYFILSTNLKTQNFCSLASSLELPKTREPVSVTPYHLPVFTLKTSFPIYHNNLIKEVIEVNAQIESKWLKLAEHFIKAFQGIRFAALELSFIAPLLLGASKEEEWEILLTNDYNNHLTLVLYHDKTIVKIKEFYLNNSLLINQIQQIMEILYEIKKEISFKAPLAHPLTLLILPPNLKQLIIKEYNFLENSVFILTSYEAAIILKIEQNLQITYLEPYVERLCSYSIIKVKPNLQAYYTPKQNTQKQLISYNKIANLCLVILFLGMFVYSSWYHFKINYEYGIRNKLLEIYSLYLDDWKKLNIQFSEYDKKTKEKIEIYKIIFNLDSQPVQDIYHLQAYINISHLLWQANSSFIKQNNNPNISINVKGETKINNLSLYQSLKHKFAYYAILIKSEENKKSNIQLQS